MKYPFLSLKQANAPFEEELKHAALGVIESGWYLHGEQTELLEQEIAAICQTKYCVAVSNGLDALRLTLKGYINLGLLSEGQKVIVPGNTFIATVLAVSDAGLTPVLCDPREDTMGLDASKAADLIDDDVAAIMPVHLYGTPCWDEQLKELAIAHNLLVIEDNAQAIGAESDVEGINGTRRTGGLGHAAGISFYPTKNLGALGDAGAVVTNNERLARTVRALANYGSDRRYHNIMQGYNCRIDEIQAAMLRVKLSHLDEENARRDAIAKVYNESICRPDVITPTRFDAMRQVWHQYVIRVENRNDFMQQLEEQGVGTDIHYATPPHLQPCYFEDLEGHTALPVTEDLADHVLSLPIARPITEDDARQIAQIINAI